MSSLKDTASSAASTLAPTDADDSADKAAANYTKDIHGNRMQKGDYKDQLTEAAGGGTGQNKREGIVEKVLKYVPGGENLLGSRKEGEDQGEEKGPPERPDHDVQVEQFLRKQYHSRSGDGMPDPDKAD